MIFGFLKCNYNRVCIPPNHNILGRRILFALRILAAADFDKPIFFGILLNLQRNLGWSANFWGLFTYSYRTDPASTALLLHHGFLPDVAIGLFKNE
jgi:hypothetical protein